MAAAFCAVYVLCGRFNAGAQPAIVAAILVLGLSRRPMPARGLRSLAIPAVLAGIAVVAVAVGWLLRTLPLAGAVVFVAGMFLSVWLRNFGARASRAGTLIALPLVAMLIVPRVAPAAPQGALIELGLTVCAGFVAFAAATAIDALARRAGLPPLVAERPAPTAPSAPRNGLTVQTRMALQMAVALALAFGAGFAFFRGHWGWSVLTAFIVCSGARGRGDAAYKGVLRLAGALAGTMAAALLGRLWAPTGAGEALAIFVALFFGLWLREVNYAYWAAAITLVLALLAPAGGGIDAAFLVVRLEAILIGALCAVASAWFVFPIRTTDVVRKRLADALRALDEFVQHAHAPGEQGSLTLASFENQLGELGRVAPPLRWHRRLVRDHPEHPARWIELASELRAHARTFAACEAPGDARRVKIRKAIGVSRRAIANHGKLDGPEQATIGTALAQLRDSLRANADERKING